MGKEDALFPQRDEPAWYISLAILGAVYLAAFAIRLLHVSGLLALCMRRPIDLRCRYGAWAIVTGPTAGIGQSIAMELARLGLNLVLVGRDLTKLHDICQTICTSHGVQTKTVLYDFSLSSTPKGEEALARLREAVDGLEVGLLVNNAGVATPHAVYLHEEADAEAWARMIRVNLCAVTEVTAVVLPGMLNRGRGAVVNIGSGSSEAIPSYPLYSVYAATKRYVAHFSRSLYVEYKAKGIHVQCQVPLFVETKMTTGMVTRAGLLSRLIVPTTAMYASEAVRWIGHRRAVCMPNLCHRLQWCLCHIVPDHFLSVHRLRENLRQRAVFQQLRQLIHEGVVEHH